MLAQFPDFTFIFGGFSFFLFLVKFDFRVLSKNITYNYVTLIRIIYIYIYVSSTVPAFRRRASTTPVSRGVGPPALAPTRRRLGPPFPPLKKDDIHIKSGSNLQLCVTHFFYCFCFLSQSRIRSKLHITRCRFFLYSPKQGKNVHKPKAETNVQT